MMDDGVRSLPDRGRERKNEKNDKRRFLIIALFVLIGFISPCSQNAEASLLRLYADPSVYVNADPDPWLVDSWVSGPGGDFTLQVINDYDVKSDTNLNVIKDVYLVIAITEETKNAGLTINLNSDTIDESFFANNGDHPRIPRHGIFGDNTYYYNYAIGDLTPQEIYDLTISMAVGGDFPYIHFDAYGDLVQKGGGREDYRLNPITNPFSKDVTYNHTPEPVTLLLFGAGALGFGIFRRKI